MASRSVYSEILLDHYRHPRHYGTLDRADVVRRGSNPRCGDEIEVAVRFDGDRIGGAAFRGRGCAISIASASMMTEAVAGKTTAEVIGLLAELSAQLAGIEGRQTGPAPAWFAALAQIREHSARHRCVLLSWEALASAIKRDGR